jgi:hypothetical protein
MRTVVNVKTQKEWDNVTKKLGYVWNYSKWSNFKETSCINIKSQFSGDLDGYSEEDDKILSYAEFMGETKPKATHYELIVTDRKVIILDKENNKRGISICHPDDVFEINKGFDIAWNRLNGLDIKYTQETKSSLSKTVCKVGDIIKVVDVKKAKLTEYTLLKKDKEYEIIEVGVKDEDLIRIIDDKDFKQWIYINGVESVVKK